MRKKRDDSTVYQRMVTVPATVTKMLIILALANVATAFDDPARLVVRPDDSTVVADTRISFFCRADGNPLPNINWKVNGRSIATMVSRFSVKSMPSGLSTLRIEPVLLNDTDSVVSCTADNGVANPVVADATLTVITADSTPSGFPTIDAHPSLKSVEQGRTAHVSCRVHGDPRPKVLWLRDLVPIDVRAEGRYSVSTIGNPGALMIQQAREEDQGKYECVARNSQGVMHSKAAHLYVKVRRVPPYFSYKLEKVYRAGLGGSINLTCVAVGYPMPRVFWKKSGDVALDDPATAPIGKNVLTLSNLEQSENFTCVAVSKLGNIEATTTVEVKPLPPAPKNLRILSLTSESVQIAWDPVISDEPLTKYLVKYRKKYTESNKQIEKEVDAETTTTTIPNLEPYQLYEITVSAVAAIGPSIGSIPREIQTDEALPGAAPTQVQARSLSRNSILVKWSAVERPNGKLLGYRVYFTYKDRNTPLPMWNTIDTRADELMTTLYNLTIETRYFVKVQATNSKGNGPISELATVSTRAGIPGQPPMLTATALDSKRVQLAWEKPLYSQPVIGYVITFNGTDGEKELTLTSPHEKHMISGLEPNTYYAFQVAAQSARGTGEPCEPAIVKTMISTDDEEVLPVPSAPLNFAKKLINSTSVRLTWEEPLNWNGNKFGYNIFFQKMANGRMVGSPHQKALRIPEATETVLDNLLPNTEYAVWMNAFNRNGDGEFVEAAKFVTEGIPPSPPEVTGVVLLSDEKPLKARIDWKTPIVSPLAKPIDKYHLWYRTIDENATETHLTAEGTATSIEFSNLLMGREYLLSLAAESGEGIGLNSTERLQTPVGVPDGNIDTAKTLFNLTPDGKKMTIRWEPLEESKRNGNITSYKAILTPMDSTAERMELEVPGTASPSATFNVRPRTSYTFKVAAATMKGLGPYSPVLTINPDSNSLVGPPTNVRVEATSNSSAVIQWDFEAGQVDGFIVKFMHEPSRSGSSERWHQQTLMNPSARHLEVPHLTDPGPYAFCVLAIKNSRQGPCSDPPMVLERLTPTFMVQKLNAEWATSVSVKLKWDYNGPSNVVFYLNHTGKKEYFDNNLALKTMTTPGFKKEVDASSREYLWTNLRPYMQYTFHVGVRTQPPGARHFWPREVVVITAPTGPPFVETPMLEDIANVRAGQAGIRLKPASEEYGPIEAYWIIVVPGNYSMDDVVNLTPSDLERATVSHRAAISRQISASPSKLKKRSISPYSIAEADDLEQELKELETIQTTDPILDLNNNDQIEPSSDMPPVQEHHKKHHKKHHHHHKKKRSVPTHAYIAAKLSSDDMRSLYQADRVFLVGDEKNYNGFTNFPLEPGSRYRLMMRAFAKKPDNNDLLRAPMTEKQSKMYSDSALSETFTTKAALRAGAKSGGVWLLGPLIALLIIAILIGMLVCWWLRCNKKSAGRGHRHGSITKVALTGNIINGGPSETSKLLSNDSYARPIMNPYEPMNGNAHHMESSMDLYPLPNSHSRGAVNGTYAPVPIPMPHMNGNIVGQTMMHPVIPITELASHIDRLRVNNNAGFQQEFESIETGQHFTWEHSNMEYNKHKNRYANVVAYDHSRVILSNTEGIHGSDYINANYIDGYEKSKAYIATQGPLPETFGDFWRMVWEEGSAMIVMLTNLEERARIKCDQYWPTRGSSTYGDVQVTLMETTVLAHYTMRTMRLQVLGEPECREIRHLQYTAWPDHGVPDHPTPFLIFLKRVKTLNSPGAGPIISHCSAGIGRTGAFIVIDCMLERLRYENTVDIFGCVTALRSQRSYMVQTEDQYVFIHDAVLDAVNSGSTEIPANKLQHHVNALQQLSPIEGVSGIEMEFRHLATLKWSNTRCGVANLPANRHKNRTSSIVPFDSNRVVMHMIPGIDGSDYINASWIDGYRERGAYIATQGPTEQTLADFWRMVWEHDCAIIVMLTKTWEMGREKCVDYWPLENAAQVGTLIVEPIAEYNMPQYIMREFKLSDCQSEISRTVRHFQFTEWPEQGTPEGGELFIDFVQQVHRTKSQFGVNGPIVVHCSSGAGRTGAFIALATIIDRMKLEHVVDVFTTVKLLRTERVNMVKDSDQYHFLYHAALEYLATFDQYSS